MFSHLDDPNPPPPRPLLAELVVAEGARRRRRRAALAGGTAAALLVLLGGVRLAQLAGSGDADVNIAPAEPSPDSPGEGGESGDEISTTPDPGGSADPTTGGATPDGGAPTPLGATTFAAITVDHEVVLGDAGRQGAVVRTLVDAPDDGTELGNQVALSPDQRTLYYVATPTTGDEAGESVIFEVSTSGDGEPEIVARGSHPAVSPEGEQLAYVRNSAQIVVRDLRSEREQSFTGSPVPDGIIQDLTFTANSEAVVFTVAPPDGPATLRSLDVSFSMAAVASLNDAEELGPGDDVPAGTHWSTPDARDVDGTIGVVESCCAPVLNSEASFAFVDPSTGQRPESQPVEGVSGTILRASYDSSGQSQLVLATVDNGETFDLYLGEGGALERLDEAARYKAIDW